MGPCQALTARTWFGSRHRNPPQPSRQPRQYRIVSGPVGIGTMVTAVQYLGDRDTLVASTRMLGQGTVQFGDPLPQLWINNEPVETGSWVTVCARQVEVMGTNWFANHFRLVEAETTESHNDSRWRAPGRAHRPHRRV